MLKCLFSKTKSPPRCDKPAEYIYLGKSYCAEHTEYWSKEMEKEWERRDELTKATLEKLKE